MQQKQITVELSNGKEYAVKKLALGRYGQLLAELDDLPPEVTKTLAELDTEQPEALLAKLPALLGKSWPNILRMLEVATEIPRQTIEEELDLVDGLALLKAVFAVNDFTAVKKAIASLLSKPVAQPPKKTG